MTKISRGFSLIELVVTMVIIAILAAIAIPSYLQYVVKANRNVAKSDLMELQQFMERNYTLTNSYATLPSGTAITASALPFDNSPRSGTADYAISFSAGPTASTYTLTATPNANQSDATCGALSVTNASVQTISGTGSATYCWSN
jgi:type IV pilus assembly protein PilE